MERVLNWNRDKLKASAECSPRYMKEEIPTIPEGQPLKKRKIVSVSGTQATSFLSLMISAQQNVWKLLSDLISEADSLPLSQDGRKWFCELVCLCVTICWSFTVICTALGDMTCLIFHLTFSFKYYALTDLFNVFVETGCIVSVSINYTHAFKSIYLAAVGGKSKGSSWAWNARSHG